MTSAPGPETAAAPRRRLRIRVEGVVQGVGFRPFLFRLAASLGLVGTVQNNVQGVLIEVEGEPAGLADFLMHLEAEAPPLAAIERIETEELIPRGYPDFTILESDDTGPAATLVPADVATCDDCLRELFDPADHRYHYPFINCTHCGPRYTIIRALPYDRPSTTMAGFTNCDRCRAEYEDPADRRFHAEPIACPECGPRIWLASGDAARTADDQAAIDPIRATAAALRAGAIVALKGLGGFHLACLARDTEAVRRLRARKDRPAKPFALMVPDLEAVRRLAVLDPAEAALLQSPQRPIVLLRRRARATTREVSDDVAPGLLELGVMLPYTPLHHLLLADVGDALVMTSGNLSSEPLAFRNDDALSRLADIADLFLLHDRPIQLGVDDSVARVVTLGGERRPQLIRRSRGYAPLPLPLPIASPRPVLACGAQLKNTSCLARGGRAWPSHHIGDLGEYETLLAYSAGIEHLETLFELRPRLLVHDLHPEYTSTRYAVERAARLLIEEGQPDDVVPPTLGIQHHHAHLAAVLAEHGEHGPALGLIFDGTGYGSDGTVWGGEFLLGDLVDYERVAHLLPVPLPGGEAAIREPWRMAAAWLAAAYDGAPTQPLPAALTGTVDPSRWAAITYLARHGGRAAPLTTSMGRLFDAVAALCGLGAVVSYEGEAAIALEAASDPDEQGGYEIRVEEARVPVLDPRPMIRAILTELDSGVAIGTIAARFHNALVLATTSLCARLADRYGVRTVVLSGGVYQNRGLLERSALELAQAGLSVLVPLRVPPNDGGIAYGQAAIAAARAAAEASQGGPRRGLATSFPRRSGT